MIYWPAKAPGATLEYEFDWTDGLEDGVSITAATVTATGVTKVNSNFDAKHVTVELSGGTLGTPGIITCTITTDDATSPTDFETAILPIGEEPVTLAMARAQCRAEGTTADDEYLLGLNQSAREHVESYCGVKLVPAAMSMTFPRFCDLDLTRAPVQSITAVQYLDANGVLQTLDPATYEFVNVSADVLRPRIRLAYNQKWPSTRAAEDAVRVSAVVGYTVVPMPIIRAMLMLVAQWFDNRSPIQVDARGAPAELPNAVSALLANYRR